MRGMVPARIDVVVVGAGPTGLALAGDLGAAGVRCVVLERRVEESNLSRAFGVHARTLEQLDARGLADELILTGTPVGEVALFGTLGVDLARLPTRFPYLLVTPQYEVERVLRRRAVRHGVEFADGAEVVGLSQDAGGVDVRVRTAGGTVTCRAAYVVGADGIHSTVRQSVGLPFPGSAVIKSMMLADVRLAEPPRDVLTVNAVRDCFAFVAPFGDGWYRVLAWDRTAERPDSAPLDLAEVRDVTRRALGTDLGMRDARWMSRFHSDERQVPRYRVGRVFLAGDAAHVHSPAAAQGMNTGIQDAVNLGWKLAAAVHGWAPADLLDSYHTERHPVGRMVLRTSGALIRLVMVEPWAERTARRVLGGVALRVGPVARRLTETISGIGIAYPGGHAPAGRRAEDTLLVGDGRTPARLYQLLGDGKFVLLTPSGGGGGVRAAVEPWSDRVRVATPVGPDHPTMLVRPDGYVAWAPDGGGARQHVPLQHVPHQHDARQHDARQDQIRAALAAWCGEPGPRRALLEHAIGA